MSRAAVIILAALLAAPLSAGLIERFFKEKSESAVAQEFWDGIPDALRAGLKAERKPRYFVIQKKKRIYCEIYKVDKKGASWVELRHYGWYSERGVYSWVSGETSARRVRHKDLRPEGVADWYDVRLRQPHEIVALAAWLATRDKLMLANAKLARLAQRNAKLAEDIEIWLCEKNGWERPEGGLLKVTTTRVEQSEYTRVEGVLLLTPEAAAARLKELSTGVKAAFEKMSESRGDTKGKFGSRRHPPKVRLDGLIKLIERFEKAYADTAWMGSSKNRKKFGVLHKSVKDDLQEIEDSGYKAERAGSVDGDWPKATEIYRRLVRADPMNPKLLDKVAKAAREAASIYDAGRKCEKDEFAVEGARYYDRLIKIFPRNLAYRNYAGYCWQASGDKRRAKDYYNYVLEKTKQEKELTATETSNRRFAVNQLKWMK